MEIRLHQSLNHPNIVRFASCFEDKERVYILMEFCPNGSLNDVLRRRKLFTELEAKCVMLQLVGALQYLQSSRVIHRDLKLSNLFIGSDMLFKLGDFGLASRLEFGIEKKRTFCGTPNYVAPEILEGLTGHSFEVDIWSLGIVLYTLLVGLVSPCPAGGSLFSLL